MKCKKPWKMYWNGEYTDNGGKDLAPYRRSPDDYEILVPCGSCVACRLNYSSLWAARCMCEAKEYKYNYFLTLTIDDDHLEDNFGCTGANNLYGAPSVHMDDISAFNKALRQYFKRKYGIDGIRFVACSEYGSNYRPHYHGIYFNLPVPDLKFYKTNDYGDPLYTSEILNKIWKKGFVVVGELTFESAQYVAKYVLKDKTLPADYYEYFNIDKESIRMSRRPGIGMEWFRKHKDQVIKDNGVYINGKLVPVPDYWLRQIDYDNADQTWFSDLNGFYDDVQAKAMKALRKRLTDKTLDEELDEARRRPFTEDIQKRNGV